MNELDLYLILGLFAFGFLAAFIDSVVGGGGLISIPALLFFGLPPLTAIASNKIAASMGAVVGFSTYIRAGKVDFSMLKYLLPLAFIGSVAGGMTVRLIPPDFLKPLIIVMLIGVTLYTLRKKSFGNLQKEVVMTPFIWFVCGFISLILGFYDGFFGPGTGTFMLFAFLWVGLDFVGAAANARGLNFASNIASAIYFACAGLVDYSYSLPMGLAMMIGAYTGAQTAMKKGTGYVRILFLVMTTVLIGKQVIDLFK